MKLHEIHPGIIVAVVLAVTLVVFFVLVASAPVDVQASEQAAKAWAEGLGLHPSAVKCERGSFVCTIVVDGRPMSVVCLHRADIECHLQLLSE